MGSRATQPAWLDGLRWRAWSVRVRLGVVTMLALVPALVFLIVASNDLRQAREAEIRTAVINDARSVAAEVRSLIAGLEITLRLVAEEVARRPDPAACNGYLAEITAKLEPFTALTVLDADGRVTCSTRQGDPAVSYAERSYFMGAVEQKGRLFVGEYIVGRVSGLSALPLSFLLPGEERGRRVLLGGINLTWFAAQMAQRNVQRGSSLTIADRSGQIIYREPFSERFVGTKIPDGFLRLVAAPEAGAELVRSQDGTLRYLGYVPPAVGPPNLYVSAGVSVQQSLAIINEALRLNVLLIGMAALCSVTAAAWVGHALIHKQLLRIVNVTSAWRRGDLSTRTGMTSDEGEIGSVGSALDLMIADLATREAERRRAEESRLVLVRELQHRVKNMLAVVQAIAGQSLRGTPETRAQLDAFRARLAALATTYDLLTEENWQGANVRAVIADAMRPQVAEGRTTLRGPDLRIKPNAALAFSLAIHELATNAIKYGALSRPAGRVDVTWSVEEADGTFALTWTERGGPPVTVPERTGFGTMLLSRILAQQVSGTTEVGWQEEGLVFTLRCPLAEVQGGGERDGQAV